jgi:hypothetical protein
MSAIRQVHSANSFKRSNQPKRLTSVNRERMKYDIFKSDERDQLTLDNKNDKLRLKGVS